MHIYRSLLQPSSGRYKTNEMELNQVPFLKLLGLVPLKPKNNSYRILEDHTNTLPRYCSDLFDKNNQIVTGYENFFIKKGTVKLYPLKDFDFVGKHVVCQKCCQTFASKMSYKAHVGTSICVKTYNGPNLVYFNYKVKYNKSMRKKNKKLIEDLPHYVKNNLLNTEMLNTLQTRNNCYSDVLLERNKIKEKQRNINDDSSVKKPRGRPKKIIEVPKKRGRPKKIKAVSVTNHEQKNISSFNILERNDSMSKESNLVSVGNNVDAYNNNVNEIEKLKLVYSSLKNLVKKCWTLLDSEWQKNHNRHQSFNKTERVQHSIEEKQTGLCIEDKNLARYIESLNIDLKVLSKKFRSINDNCSYKKDLDIMLLKLNEKHDEYKQKKTDMSNGLTAGKGKENMHCTTETDHETDSTDINTETYCVQKKKVDNGIKLWMKDCGECVLSSREKCRNENNFSEKTMINLDGFSSDNNSETSDDLTSPINSNGVDRLLTCKICNTNFVSIAEWKMHHSEHLAKQSNNFLCKVCGHRFKMYKNYVKHTRVHEVTDQSELERKLIDYKPKKFLCKSCGRQFEILQSYFDHIKTHLT